MQLKGKFVVQLLRAGRVVAETELRNGIVDVGIHHLLDSGFRNQTQIAQWYCGLINNSGYTGLDPSDTMLNHSGWVEFTSYDEATREAWSPDAAATRAITNTTAMEFTINADATIKGIFITSGSAKSGTTGTLWSTGAFGSNQPVTNGDILRVVYTLSNT